MSCHTVYRAPTYPRARKKDEKGEKAKEFKSEREK